MRSSTQDLFKHAVPGVCKVLSWIVRVSFECGCQCAVAKRRCPKSTTHQVSLHASFRYGIRRRTIDPGAEPTRSEEVWFSGRGQERAKGRPWQFRGTGSVDSKTSQVASRVPGGGDSEQVRCSEISRRGPCPGSEPGSHCALLQEGRNGNVCFPESPASVEEVAVDFTKSAVDSPPATVVNALEFDLTREDSSVEGERDDMGMSAPPTARSVVASAVEDPPNVIQPSLLQDLQHELTPEPVVRNFGGHGVESESTESAHDVQEVLDAVPPAERAVAGPTDDSDHEIGDIVVTRALRAVFVCLDGVDLIVMFKTRAHVMKSPPKFLRGAYQSAMRVSLRE